MPHGDLADLAARCLLRAAEPQQGADVLERKAQLARAPDEGEDADILPAVDAATGGGALRGGQHLDPLVVTDRLDIDPAAFRQFADGQVFGTWRRNGAHEKRLDPVVATGSILSHMRIDREAELATAQSKQRLMAAGGLLGALAASSCCIMPLVLFGLGVTGAWIGDLTRLEPYKPLFIGITLAFLGYGYWLVYRSSKLACGEGEACARRFPNRIVMTGLVIATILVVAALGFDFVVPIFLRS